MRLIVGLGNPGPEYTWTPHNLGFHVIDRIAERGTVDNTQPTAWPSLSNFRARMRRKQAAKPDDFIANSYIWQRAIGDEQVILAKPQTFMNLSGTAVANLMRTFSTSPRDLIVVFDDVAIRWGKLRIRLKGSAGGHNGMRSVLERLNTDEFVRVRVGVEPDFSVNDLATYVLHPIPNSWRATVGTVVDFAAQAAETIVTEGPALAMTKFNNVRLPV